MDLLQAVHAAQLNKVSKPCYWYRSSARREYVCRMSGDFLEQDMKHSTNNVILQSDGGLPSKVPNAPSGGGRSNNPPGGGKK